MNTIKIEYNRFPKNFLEKNGAILKKGQVKKFIVLGRKYDSRLKRMFMSTSQNVPLKDLIVTDEGDLNIASLSGYKPDGTPNFREIYFHRSQSGEIVCDGNKAEDRKLYTYLKLCRWNADNKGKDFHESPQKYIFKEDDVVKRATDSVQVNELEAKAISVISELEFDSLTEYCRGLRLPNHSNSNVMKEALQKFAKLNSDNAKKILKLSSDVEVKFVGDIREAEELDIIVMKAGKWMWLPGKEPFCRVTVGRDPYKTLFNYFLSDEGQEVYKQMLVDIEDKKTELLEEESKSSGSK